MKQILAIITIAAALLSPATAATFDEEAFGRALGGWSAKGGKAAEYKSGGDHNYRTYRPRVSPEPGGGLHVTVQIDHIRGHAHDDHAIMEVTFDSKGKVIESNVELVIQGAQKVNTGPIKTALVAGGAPYAAAVIQVGETIVKSFKGLASQPSIGRKLFPGVIRDNFNFIANSARR